MKRITGILSPFIMFFILPVSAHAYQTTALITYYDLEGPMADGNWVHPGAAACTADIGMGATIWLPDGSWVVCEDAFAPQYQYGATRVDVWGRPDMVGCEAGCLIDIE